MGIFLVRIVRVGVILGGNCPRWEFSGWELSVTNHLGSNFLGDNIPSTTKSAIKK